MAKEIDLSGGLGKKTVGKQTDANEQTTDKTDADINHIKPSYNDLSSIVGPGASNEELLARLLQTPEEKLIPWEECNLPSKGIYYGWPDGVIMVKAMGQAAEKVLATTRLAQSGQSIDYLFAECCKFPDGFDAADLLLGDRVFLLYYIRGITHGNMYEFALTCPGCEKVSTHSYDLNDLARTIIWAKPSIGTEPFKVVLPYLSKTLNREFYVGVRFLRGVDANNILAQRKAKKSLFAKPGGVRTRNSRQSADVRGISQTNKQLDDSVTENMQKIITHVMGVTDVFQIRQFIDKMHAQDTAAIREWLRDNTPGIDNTVTVECPECSQEITMELPITESFFRPSRA